MVDIDIEMTKYDRKPRVIIHCNYDNLNEAEELKNKIKKAMEVIENENKMS